MIRLIGYFFGIATVFGLAIAAVVGIYISSLTKDLPDYEVLARYEPPVTTRVHASDGSLMGEFARERRLYLPIQAIPDRVKAAFLSAEDKNFYTHPGIDYEGVIRAALCAHPPVPTLIAANCATAAAMRSAALARHFGSRSNSSSFTLER